MKKVAIIFIALSIVSCKKEQIYQTYKGDLINIQIESNSSTLYVNNIEYVSNINKLDTNIRLFAHDTIRIINKSYANDTQHIKCTINYNKYYSAIYYNNHIYDSVKACPSYSRIIYNDNSLIFTIAYRYKS